MTEISSTKRTAVLIGIVTLVSFGAVVGAAWRPARAREQAVRPGRVDETGDLQSLLAEIRGLRSDFEVQVLRWNDELERLAQARAAPRSARVPVATESDAAVSGGLDPTRLDARLAALGDRLAVIAEAQRSLVLLGQMKSSLPEIAVPPGTSVREYLGALKSMRNGEDVARAHQLWEMHRVRGMYGPPDEVKPHDDYVEWVYWLGEDLDPFDFHFVNELCVQAH